MGAAIAAIILGKRSVSKTKKSIILLQFSFEIERVFLHRPVLRHRLTPLESVERGAVLTGVEMGTCMGIEIDGDQDLAAVQELATRLRPVCSKTSLSVRAPSAGGVEGLRNISSSFPDTPLDLTWRLSS
jgi:hypothetical protein